MSTFYISNKGLTTLKGVSFPENITILCCYGNQLTSLEHCPASVTVLYCRNNQLRSLEHCPTSVTTLSCYDNQLTLLEYCPESIGILCCYNNPFYDKDLSLFEIHKINRNKRFLKGIKIVQRMFLNSMARRIQQKWRWWFYDDLDGDGISRFARRSVDELNDNIS